MRDRSVATHNAERSPPLASELDASGGHLRMVVSSMHEHIDYIQVMLLYRRKEFMGRAR